MRFKKITEIGQYHTINKVAKTGVKQQLMWFQNPLGSIIMLSFQRNTVEKNPQLEVGGLPSKPSSHIQFWGWLWERSFNLSEPQSGFPRL